MLSSNSFACAQLAEDIRVPEHAAKRNRQLAAWQRVIPDMFPKLQVRPGSPATSALGFWVQGSGQMTGRRDCLVASGAACLTAQACHQAPRPLGCMLQSVYPARRCPGTRFPLPYLPPCFSFPVTLIGGCYVPSPHAQP